MLYIPSSSNILQQLLVKFSWSHRVQTKHWTIMIWISQRHTGHWRPFLSVRQVISITGLKNFNNCPNEYTHSRKACTMDSFASPATRGQVTQAPSRRRFIFFNLFLYCRGLLEKYYYVIGFVDFFWYHYNITTGIRGENLALILP